MDYAEFAKTLREPFWVPGLARWSWRRPDGIWQGTAQLVEQPGLANLIWLALDRDTPPEDGFDMRDNPLVMWVFAALNLPCYGVTLQEWCASHSLAEFAGLAAEGGQLGQLVELARRRVSTC